MRLRNGSIVGSTQIDILSARRAFAKAAPSHLAYSISDDGVRALQLDGGNAWFRIAKLQNGRFLWDVRQEWASVFNWEFQATNNQGLTPQQVMDKEFAEKGIPVELRPQLVGEGPSTA